MLLIREVYQATAILAHVHPGWGLTEIKNLTPRERTYWMDLARYDAERRNSPQ